MNAGIKTALTISTNKFVGITALEDYRCQFPGTLSKNKGRECALKLTLGALMYTLSIGTINLTK